MPPITLFRRFSSNGPSHHECAGNPYSLEFDPAGDVVTIWTRDGGKRLRRMIAEVQERGISTLDGILT
jgi:hypothetical protein